MTRNTFEYEIEGKIYDSPDEARNHVRKSADPIVKVWYIKSNGLKTVTIKKPFFEIFKNTDLI
jgi:hypothetical protein